MPTFTYTDRCKGNGKCVEICPCGIRAIDPVTNKGYTVEPNFCWECYSCVKECPENAIDVRGYSDFAPLNHQVMPKRDEKEQKIVWNIVYRNGVMEKRFEFPIRTTDWDSIELPKKEENDDGLDDQCLSNEDEVVKIEKKSATISKQENRGGN